MDNGGQWNKMDHRVTTTAKPTNANDNASTIKLKRKINCKLTNLIFVWTYYAQ